MITIATNMAGRGTDIVLGGNVEKLVEAIEHDESLDAPPWQRSSAPKSRAGRASTKGEGAGGLRIIATERHESRRIDNQLRGRAGRQGDPGLALLPVPGRPTDAHFRGRPRNTRHHGPPEDARRAKPSKLAS